MTATIRDLALRSATIAVLLVLTACAGVPASRPAATSSPPAAAPASPEPVQPELSSRPEARVPLSCDELVAENERARALGVPAATISALPYPMTNGSMAMLQGGLLSCEWVSSAEVDDALGRWSIHVEVLPDAADAYQTMASSFPADGFVPGLVGSRSLVSCGVDGSARSCTARFETNGYWVELAFSGLTTLAATDPALTTDAGKIGTAIQVALTAAGAPRPAFVPAADAVQEWDSCGAVDGDGQFGSELGSPSFVAPEPYESGPAMFSVAMQRGGFTSCVWRHADVYATPSDQLRQVGIEMIPGAGWAWAELVEAAVTKDADAAITVPGADSALIVCWGDDECTAQALVRGSYVGANASNQQGNDADARAGVLRALELAIAAL